MKYQRAIENFERGLTQDELVANFPALYAEEPHVSRSRQYVMLPTGLIIDAMSQHGLVPTQVMQALPRQQTLEQLQKPLQSGRMRKLLPRLAGESDEAYELRIYHDRVGHTSHLIRFGRPRVPGVAESKEIVLRNAADGTKSYILNVGWVRYICRNGQVMGEFDTQVSFMHIRTVVEEIMEATLKILNDQRVPKFIELMNNTKLTYDEELLLAYESMKARFAPEPEVVEGTAIVLPDEEEEQERQTGMQIYRPEQFARRFHYEDRDKHDLNTAVNAAQEALVTPNRRITARTYDDRGRTHKHTLSNINSINERVKVTKRIMTIAEKMVAMKNGMSFEQLQDYLKG